jgi:hypothetical protein
MVTRQIFGFSRKRALYLQPSVPSFEYPRTDLPENLHFIGSSIPAASDWPPPSKPEIANRVQ